jgi:hypothetical protein
MFSLVRALPSAGSAAAARCAAAWSGASCDGSCATRSVADAGGRRGGLVGERGYGRRRGAADLPATGREAGLAFPEPTLTDL